MRELTLCVCVFVYVFVYVCVCVWQYQTDVTVNCVDTMQCSPLMKTPLLLWASPVIPFPRPLLPSFTSPSTSPRLMKALMARATKPSVSASFHLHHTDGYPPLWLRHTGHQVILDLHQRCLCVPVSVPSSVSVSLSLSLSLSHS